MRCQIRDLIQVDEDVFMSDLTFLLQVDEDVFMPDLTFFQALLLVCFAEDGDGWRIAQVNVFFFSNFALVL
jgi:hypothetical protein